MEAGSRDRTKGVLYRVVITALLLGGVALAVRAIGPMSVGEHARRTFLGLLRDHFPDLRVTIRRGHYEPGLGLVFEDIRIADPSASMVRPRPMLRIERLVVVSAIDPRQALRGESPLSATKVVVDGLQLDSWISEDGTLSATRLWPPPELGPVCPRVEFVRGRLRLLDSTGRQRPLSLDIERGLALSQSCADPSAGPDPSVGPARRSLWLEGSSEFARAVRVQIRSEDQRAVTRLVASQVRVNDEWLNRLPARWCPRLDEFEEIRCGGDVDATVTIDRGRPSDYRVRVQVNQGRIAHRRLPHPLNEIRGGAVLSPGRITFSPCQARFGEAICRWEGEWLGSGDTADFDLRLRAAGLLFDDRIAAKLPPPLRERWDRLQPHGHVDWNGSLRRISGDWDVEGTLTCHGVDVAFDRFPYPVGQLVGKLQVRDGWLASDDLRGRLGTGTVRCVFRVPLDDEQRPESSFVFTGDGVIPLDETLISALTPRDEPASDLERFVRSLNPSGSLSLSSAVIRRDATGREHRRFELGVINGRLRYEDFPYPLYNVTGRIRVSDDQLELSDFRGTNANAGVVDCRGSYRMGMQDRVDRGELGHHGDGHHGDSGLTFPTPSPGMLDLIFSAGNVAMDDALRLSLPAASRHVWDAISPRGILDQLRVRIRRDSADSPLGLDILASQQDTTQVTNRTLSVRPRSIPYRLDITGGQVHYGEDRVTIRALTARHDASQFSADGECVPNADDRWELTLHLHGGSRVQPDAELIDALPPQMEEGMRRLQLRGPVSVRGTTRVLLSDERHPEPIFDWDLLLQLEGNRIGDVGPVRSIRGEIAIQGRRDEDMLAAAGEVRIDSMHVRGQQLTAVRGPFTILDDRLELGTFRREYSQPTVSPIQTAGLSKTDHLLTHLHDPRPGGRGDGPRTIRGTLFGGIFDIEGVATLSTGDFDVQLALLDAPVPTLLADLGHADRELTGTVSGQTRLAGRLGAAELLSGSGRAHLSGANLYKLPLLMQVLNQLRVTPTEDVAFTDGDIEFTIDDDQIRFGQLQLWGSLVALHGFGTLNRRGELDLSFHTRVSPQNVFTKFSGPLRHTRYTLWTVDVRGPIDSPTIERKALEGVGQTLERLFPGMNLENEGSEIDGPRRPLAVRPLDRLREIMTR